MGKCKQSDELHTQMLCYREHGNPLFTKWEPTAEPPKWPEPWVPKGWKLGDPLPPDDSIEPAPVSGAQTLDIRPPHKRIPIMCPHCGKDVTTPPSQPQEKERLKELFVKLSELSCGCHSTTEDDWHSERCYKSIVRAALSESSPTEKKENDDAV